MRACCMPRNRSFHTMILILKTTGKTIFNLLLRKQGSKEFQSFSERLLTAHLILLFCSSLSPSESVSAACLKAKPSALLVSVIICHLFSSCLDHHSSLLMFLLFVVSPTSNISSTVSVRVMVVSSPFF